MLNRDRARLRAKPFSSSKRQSLYLGLPISSAWSMDSSCAFALRTFKTQATSFTPPRPG
jgi:hypothetical protein